MLVINSHIIFLFVYAQCFDVRRIEGVRQVLNKGRLNRISCINIMFWQCFWKLTSWLWPCFLEFVLKCDLWFHQNNRSRSHNHWYQVNLANRIYPINKCECVCIVLLDVMDSLLVCWKNRSIFGWGLVLPYTFGVALFVHISLVKICY